MSNYPDKIEAAIDEHHVLLSFLFHLGNSTNGQVGTCVRVIAKTPTKAVSKVREVLRNRSSENKRGYDHVERNDVEYVAHYFNVSAISEEDILESETEIYDVLQQEEALQGAYD